MNNAPVNTVVTAWLPPRKRAGLCFTIDDNYGMLRLADELKFNSIKIGRSEYSLGFGPTLVTITGNLWFTLLS
jgi:hypothetical protein